MIKLARSTPRGESQCDRRRGIAMALWLAVPQSGIQDALRIAS